MKERQSKMYIIVGKNGTGKTYFVRQFLQRSSRRALIMNPTNEDKWDEFEPIKADDGKEIKEFKGIRQLKARLVFGDMAPEYRRMLRLVWDKYENGVLVMDDCREMVEAKLSKEVGSVMRGFRQHNMDVFAMFHSINQVPPMVWDHVTYLVLFYTQDNLDKVKKKLPTQRIGAIEQASIKVNSRGPEGHNPEIIVM